MPFSPREYVISRLEASAVDLKRGLDRGLRIAVSVLREVSGPVSSRKEKAQVATISAHNDSTIGELVADALKESARKASSRWRRLREQRLR